MGAGTLVIFANALRSLNSSKPAPANPWGAGTLEWATPSPAPDYNFAHPPKVFDRFPLWAHANEGPVDESQLVALSAEEFPQQPDRRESPGTRLMNATLERTAVVASPTIWPLLAALSLAVMVIGSIFNLWFLPGAAPFVFASIVGWLWPKKGEW